MSSMKFTSTSIRRGNALILVVGILVLLVLVATAFITRTQSGRFVISAQRDAAEINDQARSIGRSVADELAVALFPREYVWTSGVPDYSANAGRKTPNANALRYGHDPNNPFNFAPYEVIPWTNPPDPNPTYTGYGNLAPLSPTNPIGGPSYGDSRWLRDTEPQRADFYTGLDYSSVSQDGTPETFSHWRHLTNLSRSDNLWRVVKDISNVTGGGLVTNLDTPIEQWPVNRIMRLDSTRLGLGNGGGYPSLVDGDGGTDLGGEFQFNLMQDWMNLSGWLRAQGDPLVLPQNFIDLSDLDGDGVQNEIGERKQDAFVSGQDRWYVERTLTDTDGDGFTDAYWHLAPVAIGSDMLQVVAVSITDNSALLNANVATRFYRDDFDAGSDGFVDDQATRGQTPADLALVGSNGAFNWSVGFFDNPSNLPADTGAWVIYDHVGGTPLVDWNTTYWNSNGESSFLDELGIEEGVDNPADGNDANPIFEGTPTNDVSSRYGRLWYWQLSGRDPLNATNGFRPFTHADELELRSFEGNNNQFVASRFEVALNNPDIASPTNQFLRSTYTDANEATELRDQLTNQQLVFDNRRKLTMFSGARNDLLPPWLRWEERFWERHNPDNFLNFPAGYTAFDLNDPAWTTLFPDGGLPLFTTFSSSFPASLVWESVLSEMDDDTTTTSDRVTQTWLEQSRTKVDLREYYADSIDFATAQWWESNADGRLTLAERAPLQLLLAMTDSQEGGTSLGANISNAPLGTFSDDAGGIPFNTNITFDSNTFGTDYYNQARLMAAGLASNLLAYRDGDDNWRQHSSKSLIPDVANLPTGEATPRSMLPLSAAVSPPVIGRQANAPSAFPLTHPLDGAIAGPNEQSIQMLGLEAQPFILEAFIGHVHGAETEYIEGACCLDGYCEVISENTCVAFNGVFEGEDSLCEDVVCEFGACCIPDGGCIVTIQDNCELYFGEDSEYLGDGTDCSDTPCEGACCVLGVNPLDFSSSACAELSKFSCAQIGGVFNDYNTECASTSCTMLGSCCLESGTCVDVLNQTICNGLAGTFSIGEFCASEPCLGACCVNFSFCIQVDSAGCLEMDGQFLGTDQVCTNTTCNTSGACCLGSDSCQDMEIADECNLLGGEFIFGESCVNVPCFGSCCLGAGACDDVSVVTCLTLNGEFVQGATCDAVPCRSACCFATGGCENFLSAVCDDFGGTFIGGGTSCATDPCVPIGACCLPDDPGDDTDGGCLDIMAEGCTSLGGTFNASLVCGNTPCGTDVIRGACCLDTGVCQNVVSQEVCTTLGGIYQGENISCAENPCNPAFACCLEDATCVDVLEASCADLGGIFQDGLTCAEGACEGACCIPDNPCVDMTSSDCALAGGTFNEFQMCDSQPCDAEGACCIGDDVCDVVSDVSCAALAGVFQGSGTDCTTDPCNLGALGACCMDPIGCITILQTACDAALGGIFLGGDCTTNPCVTGSCCLQDGESDHCVEVLNEASCDSLDGTFHDGLTCDEEPCVGVCCLWAGGCEELSMDTCENLWDPDGDLIWEMGDAPGVFRGVGTVCADDLCIPLGGSCCLFSGTCVDLVSDQSFIDYCQSVLGGKYRPTEFCADTECGSACCLCPSECAILTEEQCNDLGGTFNDGNPSCNLNPCNVAGTCCFGSGSCIEVVDEGCCEIIGGSYNEGDTCIANPCTPYFIVDDRVGDDLDPIYTWSDFQGTVSVLQLANPFDREIDLFQYGVEWFGKSVRLDSFLTADQRFLAPSSAANPTTLILYSLPDPIPDTPDVGDRIFEDDWLDFLDIDNGRPNEHPANTVIVQVPSGAWGLHREDNYDTLVTGEQNSIALYRFDEADLDGDDVIDVTERVLVDRIDAPDASESYEKRITEDLKDEWDKLGTDRDQEDDAFKGYITTEIEFVAGTEALLVMWDRVTRAWGTDVPAIDGWHNDHIDSWEQNPRYVFGTRDFVRSADIRPVTILKNDGEPRTTNISYTSEFHWTKHNVGEFPLGDPDNMNGEPMVDTTDDDDALPDDPNPWFTVDVWSPKAGEFRPVGPFGAGAVQGEVKGGIRTRKPTFFDMDSQQDPQIDQGIIWSFPDKGWYGQTVDLDGDKSTSDTPAFEDTDVEGDQGFESIQQNEIDMALTFPMQMLQKDSDFEQVGELLNVWLLGHMLEGVYDSTALNSYLDLPDSHLDGGDQIDAGTITTFSEFMYPKSSDWFAPWVGRVEVNRVTLDERVNRLRFAPQGSGGEGSLPTPFMLDGRNESDGAGGATATNNPWPRQSIASRVLDSFVCDGPGRPDLDNDGSSIVTLQDVIDNPDLRYGDLDPDDNMDFESTSYWHSYYNANGFSGKATTGLININTAPVEVLRTLPHMYKTVHPTQLTLTGNDQNPRLLVPESIVQWRELHTGDTAGVLSGLGFTGGPNYSVSDVSNRSLTTGLTVGGGLKDTRGFSSPSEIGLLQQYGTLDDVLEPWHIDLQHQAIRDARAWSISFAAMDPFMDATDTGELIFQDINENFQYDVGESTAGAPLSTDVNTNTYYGENAYVGDGVSGDSEEINLLQAGISNLIVTNSDVFTVHMRIRTFKRNPITGVWDATDIDQIVDDSRYVMLVDRSNVESPSDKPRILYFEKLPN